MKKIIHLLSLNKLSGAERVAISIISELKSRFRFAYCCPEGPIVEVLKKNDIEWIPIDGKISPFSVRNSLKGHSFDAIHAHDYRASVFASIAFPRALIVSHLHSNCPWSENFDLRSVLYYFFRNRYRKIVVVSRDIIDRSPVLNFIADRHPAKFVEIMNAINVEKVLGFATETPCDKPWDIVFCGRLTEAKFPERFIEVISELKKFLPAVKAVMLGDGELSDQIKNMIQERGLEDNVSLLGFVANPFAIIKNSKVMVITSRWEGFPMVAIEALTLNVPVVSTPVSGMGSLEKNSGGVYIADSVVGISEKAFMLLQNEPLRLQVGNNAGQWIQKNLDSVQFSEKMIKLYDDVLSQQ